VHGEGQTIGGRSMESMTGQLLVATPSLKDPNFDRTVVLLVAHEPGGALGVVLNRATEVPVADVLGPWERLARDPAVLFEGGPVQPESAICLARLRVPGQRVRGIQQVSGLIGTVDLSVDPERLQDSVNGIRVFAGYSGWSPGQLEEEIASGSWYVLDGLPGDAFMERPDDLWSMVLRRQGGLLAAVAHFPPDVALN
jgi:putative transcriptional regulator